jgi:hypothetical protein
VDVFVPPAARMSAASAAKCTELLIATGPCALACPLLCGRQRSRCT